MTLAPGMSNFRRMSLYSFINWNGALLPGNRFGTANILFVIVVATLPPYPNSRIWILWPKQGQGFKYSTANLTQILFQYHRPPMFRQPLLSFQLNQIKSIFWATVITFFAFPYLVLFSFVIWHALSCISLPCLHISGLQQAFLHIYHHRIVGEDHHTSGISFDSPYHRSHCRRSTDPIFPNYRSRELKPKY